MKVLELQGTSRRMGQAFGEECRRLIRDLYQRRMANAIEQAASYGGRTMDEKDILRLAGRCLPLVQAFHPDGFDELTGIAEGAQLDLAQIWAMNALTDLRDVAAFGPRVSDKDEGCSSFIAQSDRTEDRGVWCGQTWDLSTDNMPFVLMVRRRPQEGPQTLCLTTAGCLSLIGMNEHGVAVGTTNLRSNDARFGVGYLDIIHKALTCRSTAEAVSAIARAPRSGAHYFYVVDGQGEGAAVECTATDQVVTTVSERVYVHCNHFLIPQLIPLEIKGTPTASTGFRQRRLTELLLQGPSLSAQDMMSALEDTSGGTNAISRHDFDGISTNGAVVMAPHLRTLWAVHGPPDNSAWQRMTLESGSAGAA
ncbi:MAG: C45 family peptidase [Myxococcota bacterium]